MPHRKRSVGGGAFTDHAERLDARIDSSHLGTPSAASFYDIEPCWPSMLVCPQCVLSIGHCLRLYL